jgi:hypothetical protein
MEQIGASQSWLINPIFDPATSFPQLLACHVAEDLWPLYTAYYWQHDPLAVFFKPEQKPRYSRAG